MKKIYLLFIIFTFHFSLSALSFAYERIVSLAPSVTRSLYELGAESKVVGITIFCPSGTTKKESIGTLLEPNLEKIILLKPDLIIATKEGNNKAAVEKLIRWGFPVYVMETSDSFDEICANYLWLGEKIGKKNKALFNIENARNKISLIREHAIKYPQQKVFWEVGALPLYGAGGKSFVNDYNYYTNTVNVLKDINQRYPQIGIESVLIKNPDIIILVNMGDISGEELAYWQKYTFVSAVKNSKIFMIDVNDIFTPTPLTFARGVEMLALKIYGDFFEK